MTARTRIGVLGAGYWAASTLLPALAARDDVQLVVVSRRNGELARRVADRFGAEHATDDWEEALRHDLDAVIVATPPNVHEAQVTAALQAGAHVLCEKPFALDGDAAWRMVDAARAAGRGLIVGFGWNYLPLFRTVRRAAESIGDVEFVSVELFVPVRDLFVGGAIPEGPDVLVPRNRATFVDPEVSAGGALPGNLSHAFGLAWYLSRLEVADVAARLHMGAAGVDVHATTTLGYVGGGVGSVVGASTHAGSIEWTVTLVGSGGQVHVDSRRGEVRVVPAAGPASRLALPENAGENDPTGPLLELLALARGARQGDEGAAELGARTVDIVDAAYASDRTGVRQQVPDRRTARRAAG